MRFLLTAVFVGVMSCLTSCTSFQGYDWQAHRDDLLGRIKMGMPRDEAIRQLQPEAQTHLSCQYKGRDETKDTIHDIFFLRPNKRFTDFG